MSEAISAADEPLAETVRKHAFEHGYVELRFNPRTMWWAWHKPDQAVGPDGRIYVRRPDR